MTFLLKQTMASFILRHLVMKGRGNTYLIEWRDFIQCSFESIFYSPEVHIDSAVEDDIEEDPNDSIQPKEGAKPEVLASSSSEDVFSVSFEDISALRESLESDAAITKSLVSKSK